MKKFISAIYLISLFFTIFGCDNKNRSHQIDNESLDKVENIQIEEIIVEGPEPIVKIDSIDIDTLAIGNIGFGISQDQFNKEKSNFLREHATIGELPVNSIKGYFVDGKLAGIEIKSSKHNKFIKNTNEFHGWEELYNQKYRGRYDFMTHGYETSMKHIYVTDGAAEQPSPKNFNELINNKVNTLSYIPTLPNIKFQDNVEGMMYIGQAFANVNSSRGRQLKDKMNREIADSHNSPFGITTPIYQRYYDLIRDEANANIESHNKKISVSPSWSIIRIVYKPLKAEYDMQISKEKEDKKNAVNKDLNII